MGILAVKIGDLGLATGHSTGSKPCTHSMGIGTQLYVATEQERNQYGNAVDIYALGILIHPKIQHSAHKRNLDARVQGVNELKFRRILPSELRNHFSIASSLILKLT